MRVASGKEIVVGVSGASGAALAVRFLKRLSESREVARIHLVVTASALTVARNELAETCGALEGYLSHLSLAPGARGKLSVHSDDDLAAPISSGSYPAAGMAVVPCSAGTLAAIAHGTSRGLLQRAADVTLKERRPLVLAFREAPYSLIHLENMRSATLAGAIVMSPAPPFYIGSRSLDRLLDASCARLARFLGIPVPEEFIWKGPRSPR